ncbi:hypothetical protein [Sphingomonas faeni]|uniref:hypothetical protein n=1 Tax=Sphingomonas faeni TaxID=185950 RepID=UPI0020C7F04E|nr:hypothetical protein [Sphingomonas faeni]MCP8891872.1 hypothetical protein [Sphingomonas faeni]
MKPYNLAFAILVAEYGYALSYQAANGPPQYSEQIVKTHQYGETVVDSVTFHCVQDRQDNLGRTATLIGSGVNRRFGLNELLLALGLDPTGTDADFLTAGKHLDTATVERLAPA